MTFKRSEFASIDDFLDTLTECLASKGADSNEVKELADAASTDEQWRQAAQTAIELRRAYEEGRVAKPQDEHRASSAGGVRNTILVAMVGVCIAGLGLILSGRLSVEPQTVPPMAQKDLDSTLRAIREELAAVDNLKTQMTSATMRMNEEVKTLTEKTTTLAVLSEEFTKGITEAKKVLAAKTDIPESISKLSAQSDAIQLKIAELTKRSDPHSQLVELSKTMEGFRQDVQPKVEDALRTSPVLAGVSKRLDGIDTQLKLFASKDPEQVPLMARLSRDFYAASRIDKSAKSASVVFDLERDDRPPTEPLLIGAVVGTSPKDRDAIPPSWHFWALFEDEKQKSATWRRVEAPRMFHPARWKEESGHLKEFFSTLDESRELPYHEVLAMLRRAQLSLLRVAAKDGKFSEPIVEP